MYSCIHSLLRSHRAATTQKNPVSQPVQDVRNFQIVKEQQIIKGKAFLSFNDFSGSTDQHREMWWSQAGSNRRPPACKAGALPAELWPRNLSFVRLALLVVRSLGHVPVCTLPAFAHKPPRQPEKILRYLYSFQPRSFAIFGGSRRSRVTFIAINERGSNKEPAKMVGLGRFELPTSPLSGVRSNQLSYRPSLVLFSPGFIALLVRSVMYVCIHSLPLSKRASPAKKIPARAVRQARDTAHGQATDHCCINQITCEGAHAFVYCRRFLLFKGGDPAARSRTATLLRLHPSHKPHRGKRPPEG